MIIISERGALEDNNVIRYTKESFSIKNYAVDGPLNNEKLFQRFYKEEPSAESKGLGLAIVRDICTLAGFRIQ